MIVRPRARKEIIISGNGGSVPRHIDQALMLALARARSWIRALRQGEYADTAEIGRRFGFSNAHVRRLCAICIPCTGYPRGHRRWATASISHSQSAAAIDSARVVRPARRVRAYVVETYPVFLLHFPSPKQPCTLGCIGRRTELDYTYANATTPKNLR